MFYMKLLGTFNIYSLEKCSEKKKQKILFAVQVFSLYFKQKIHNLKNTSTFNKNLISILTNLQDYPTNISCIFT